MAGPLAFAYDSLGRKTGSFVDRVGGTKLAEWIFDTAGSGKGQLASSTRYVNGNAYTNSTFSYTALYKPTETSVVIPAAEGPLAGTYTWSGGYSTADGSLTGESYPAAGGLPRETVNYVLDDQGRPLTTSGAYNGTVELVSETSYTRYGELQRLQMGTGTKRTWLSAYYEDHTRRLSRTIVDAEVPRPMQTDTHYTYDPAGNITSIVDKPLEQTPDVQCFRYDHLRRLTESWTPGLATWSQDSGCRNDPAVAGLAGPAPYWHSYRYDTVGNRLNEVQHSATGDTNRAYTYPAAGGPQPHSLTSVTTARPGKPDATDRYGYDPVGNTSGRTIAGVDETLSWDQENHLDAVTKNGQTTSFVYTTDGQRLLRKDPSGTTLYLGKQEIHLPTSSQTPAGTRYYTHGGKTIAVRQGATLTWLADDHQASPQIAVNSSTLQVVRRRQLPFGGSRDASPAPAWPGERGFVGGTLDASTGLTHLGAREYDPGLGRFISVDPVMDLTNPQQLHGYVYSENSPITRSDPTGLTSVDDRRGTCGERPIDCQPAYGAPAGGGSGAPHSGGPGPVTVGGVGEEGMATARGIAHDISVLAKRRGYKTNVKIFNVQVAVPNLRPGEAGPPSGYSYVNGVVIALTFTPVPQCVDPIRNGPSYTADTMTQAERAAYNAAHPPEPERPRPMTAREFLANITGVSAIVDCVKNPSVGGCLNAAASVAPLPVGKIAAAAGRGASIPAVIYRSGTPSPSNLRLRPGEDALSFRDSLSNPLPPADPVFVKREWIGIDTSRLPAGTVVPDGIPGSATTPPGHVSVYVDDWEMLKDSVIERGKFPK